MPPANSVPVLQEAGTLLKQRRPVAAAQVLDAAPPQVARMPAWGLLRGVVHTRLGRIDEACALLLPLTDGAEPLASEAAAALADAYHFAHRHDALRALLERGGPWARTPRGTLFAARLLVGSDPAQALALLLGIVDGESGKSGESSESSVQAGLQRIAGFDAVKLLDRMGRYRDAFDLATRLHASSRADLPAFDLPGFLAAAQQQMRLLGKGAGWCRPRAEAVDDVAFIVGMPRSGTTLLEQMLDCHPAVAGIGEHEGIGDIAQALLAAGVWPYRLNHLPADAATAMQQHYRRTARQRSQGDAAFTLDKSLLTWRWLPAVAAVLPGARCLHVLRDARDMAISSLLSYFDPLAFGWTGSLDALRQVIAAERALVPLALQTLQLRHATIVYEDLVADPRVTLQRCVDLLGLPMDERVLRPQDNPRTAITLSHAQVRRPVNDASIGRWRHYDFAFDDDRWDALA